jgi:phosphate transport system substrate-binding protein
MNKTKWFLLTIPLMLLITIGFASCSSPAPASTVTPTQTTTAPAPTTPTTAITQASSLDGAGASFPAPLYTKWFDEYNKITGVEINYQPIGSGGGIKAITEGTVDFGASDGIMTDERVAAAEAASGPILHIPMTSGAVAIIYNLEGLGSEPLKLTSDILADIYLKKITKWNDPRITAINQGLNLPDADIAVVHRSDGSGTTFIFTNYLSKVSDEWKTRVGNATSVDWPGDIGGEKNAGVAGQVKQIPGSIGYVELAYAVQNQIAWAQLKNDAGKYIEPSLEATTKAAEGVALPDDMKVMITNSTNPDAYPIAGFTWILAYVNQSDPAKGLALVNMLWWAIHDGQQYTNALDYAPLSATAVTKAENQILSIKYQGQPLLKR